MGWLVIAIWIIFPFLTYCFYWYEVSNVPCFHNRSESEERELEKITGRKLKELFFLGLVSSWLFFPLILISYPLGWFKKLYNVERENPSMLIVFIHGLFHNRSGAIPLRLVIAGRNVNFIALGYGSFKSGFFEIVELFERELKNKNISKDLPIFFVGHSLGGLIGALLATKLKEDGFNIKKVITLGTPFYGSKLASLAISPLAKSLKFMSEEVLKAINLISNPSFRAVQFWSPADNMVFPLGSLYNVPRGWEVRMTSPLCHTSLLFWPSLVKEIVGEIEKP